MNGGILNQSQQRKQNPSLCAPGFLAFKTAPVVRETPC